MMSKRLLKIKRMVWEEPNAPPLKGERREEGNANSRGGMSVSRAEASIPTFDPLTLIMEEHMTLEPHFLQVGDPVRVPVVFRLGLLCAYQEASCGLVMVVIRGRSWMLLLASPVFQVLGGPARAAGWSTLHPVSPTHQSGQLLSEP
jgi:hypothetical protein